MEQVEDKPIPEAELSMPEYNWRNDFNVIAAAGLGVTATSLCVEWVTEPVSRPAAITFLALTTVGATYFGKRARRIYNSILDGVKQSDEPNC